MSMTREDRRLAKALYQRIWDQRLGATCDTETIEIHGESVKAGVLSLPDGLRLGWFGSGKHPRYNRGAVMMLNSDRVVPVDFLDVASLNRCHICINAAQLLKVMNEPERLDGRAVVPLFRRDDDILPRLPSYRPTMTLLLQRIDAIAARIVSGMSAYAYVESFTTPEGITISLVQGGRNVQISHTSSSFFTELDYEQPRASKSFAEWRKKDAVATLAGTLTPRLDPPPETSGNARLTRLLGLCHQALLIDPNLTDAAGTPLRPLLEKHVPDMLERHRLATRTADTDDISRIDADLERGVLHVCHAITEGLKRIADDRRNALLEQIAFLEARHPVPNELDLSETHKEMEKSR